MVFVETPLYKAWDAYIKAISHRFFEYGHGIIILLIYEILLLFAGKPKAWIYNGVDLWFAFFNYLLPWGTLIISLALVIIWGNYIWKDWFGIKDAKELKKDRDEKKKKGKNFTPRPKKPYRPNWYYFGFMIFEGFVYGSLIFLFLPMITHGMLSVLDEQVDICIAFDTVASERALRTNVGQDIGLAFGAGFYEEILYRGFLFMFLVWLSKRVKWLAPLKVETSPIGVLPVKIPKYKAKDANYWSIVIVGTLLFVLSHYAYPYGDHWCFYSFSYRFFFGLLMFWIFSRRKFAVAAWAHVFYDLWYFGSEWF